MAYSLRNIMHNVRTELSAHLVRTHISARLSADLYRDPDAIFFSLI